MKSGLYFVLACVMGLGALVLVGDLGMAAHDVLYPSPGISIRATVLGFGFLILLFAGAIFMAYRLLRYAASDPKK